uniref:Ribosomal protein S12 n=1 Tax=Stachyamoeba lipophora TaxID=463046 RepID=A0A0B5GNR4_STALP|nr:ribosomal protein S12 [Stachyamoeba lipophora]AJF22929.1 ribosomal protein S12 [Stachyamoeba lipophora]
MITLRQLVKNPRDKKAHKSLSSALLSCPQKKGTVLRVFEQAPKKPNSARRKVAKVKLKTGKIIRCHIPGIGHNLQQHSSVLVRGGRCQDLIGVRYKPIRGKESFEPLYTRKTRRSKYGVKTKNT